MGKVHVNGIDIHYQQTGAGDDVVLIHGITANLSVWYRGILPYLRERFRVTCYDLRGHGYSGLTPTGYTSRDMAQDLLGLLDALSLPRAHLLGHSFGGAIALHTAVLAPERVKSIVINDAGIFALRGLYRVKDWPGWKVWGEDLEKMGFRPEDADFDPVKVIRGSFDVPIQFGLRKGMKRKTKEIERLVDHTSMIADFRTVAGLDEDALLGIRQPVLAVYGEDSPFVPVGQFLAEKLPACRLVTLSQSGHFYVMQTPPELLAAVGEFLSGYSGP